MDNINTDYWTGSFSLSVFASSRPAELCAQACSAEPLSVNTQSGGNGGKHSGQCSFSHVCCTCVPFFHLHSVYLGMTVNSWDSRHHFSVFINTFFYLICQCWRTFLWPHVVSPGLLLATSLCMSAAPFCRRETTMLTYIHSYKTGSSWS